MPTPYPTTPATLVPDADNTLTKTHRKESKVDVAELNGTTEGHVGVTTTEFFEVLETVADNITVLGVPNTVKIAKKVIQACEKSPTGLKHIEQLTRRIQGLITVLVGELKDKKLGEIKEKQKEEIHDLEKDMTYIQQKLDKLVSQNAFFTMILKTLNQNKVRKCMARLNNSLESFNLVREIDDSTRLGELQKQIVAFDKTQNKLRDIRVIMDQVASKLNKYPPSAPSSGPVVLNGVMPNTRILHGRETIVDELVAVSTRTSPRARVCIMGPGGMGKTATALAVMAHADMKKSFPDHSRVWVPCANATSIYLFLDRLCLSLGITGCSGNPLKDIIAVLTGLSQPLILLLDNFETPWNIDEAQTSSQVKEILCDIAKIPHVVLLVTMQSSSPPSQEQIEWYPLHLKAVDPGAALQIYSDIYGDTNNSQLRDEPDLESLLKMIGHTPLATILAAKAAKLTGLSAATLMQEYKQRGTAMLGSSAGSDENHIMDLCISLSTEIEPMKKAPEALELLATLAMLPNGATYDALKTLWASNCDALLATLEILREISLVDQQDSSFLVFPAIRQYILHPLRFPKKARDSLVDAACRFLAQHKINPRVNNGSYVEHIKAIASEAANLQAILLKTTAPTPSVIEALIPLAQHQRRKGVIDHALHLIDNLEDNPESTRLLGLALKCEADILSDLGLFEKAMASLDEALDLFLSIGDTTEDSECTLNTVAIQHRFPDRYPRQDREGLISDAQQEFEKLENDSYGIALCLFERGKLYLEFEEFPRGIEAFTQAREIFNEFQDLPRIAATALEIARTHYSSNHLEQAKVWVETAIRENEAIERSSDVIASTRLFGQILIQQGESDEALSKMGACLQTIQGGGYDVVWMLEEMGRAWAKTGRKEDAQATFKECISFYTSRSRSATALDIAGHARCQFFIRRLNDGPAVLPSKDELDALKRWHPIGFEELL
ncbi:hypothetical protein H0H81_009074 [Sphagnurus paluster]|uniref:Ancillary SecYEG translocon subunit/Cell division coordinator CpoB TPR domain-containing protein n=1 Tax=Sphagnurus paluster TaxID=117069 RepID=A0A9P7GNN4_9AGAR|nr:hypothetical protein H0H81_009074 [Sphagnurus paluster]